MKRRKKKIPKETVGVKLASKSLEEIEFNILHEIDELIDPITYRILIIPLRPTLKNRLPAVEFGSLYKQMQGVEQRLRFHPFDETLPLTEESISNYYLDHELIKKRDAYLRQQCYSLEDFLDYRGLTKLDYQRLINFFHYQWLYRHVNNIFLSLVSAAGVCGYFYAEKQQSCFDVEHKNTPSLLAVKGVAVALSVGSTVSANYLLKIKEGHLAYYNALSFGLFFSLLGLCHEQLNKNAMNAPENNCLLWGSLVIPFLQSGVIFAGQSVLRRFSIFSREEKLLKTYADRQPLEDQAELRTAVSNSYCVIL